MTPIIQISARTLFRNAIRFDVCRDPEQHFSLVSSFKLKIQIWAHADKTRSTGKALTEILDSRMNRHSANFKESPLFERFEAGSMAFCGDVQSRNDFAEIPVVVSLSTTS
jgi:hypothetical protein